MLSPEIRERRRNLFTILRECLEVSREKEQRNPKWARVSHFFADVIHNLETKEEAIWATAAQSVDAPLKVSWAENWKDANDNQSRKRASFQPWVEKAYRTCSLAFPEEREAILQMASTVYGEVFLKGGGVR